MIKIILLASALILLVLLYSGANRILDDSSAGVAGPCDPSISECL